MNDLFERFLEKIFQDIEKPFEKRYLLTISGGIDSMVMWNLFDRAGLNIEIAHVNFQLRGEDSEKDQQLVEEIARSKGHRLHLLRENTYAYACQKGISIEMAAREIRYQFFFDIAEKHAIDYICTAHQLDDLLETFFIALYQKGNVFKLTGLRTINNKLYRPMLFFPRSDIANYAQKYRIPYRDDYTNTSTIFLRNKIRNVVLPAIETSLPGFRKQAYASISFLQEAGNFLRYIVPKELEKYMISPNQLDVEKLRSHPHAQWLLEQFLLNKGGKVAWAGHMLENVSNKAIRYFSSQHEFIFQRGILYIEQRNEKDEPALYYIEDDLDTRYLPFKLSLELREIRHSDQIKTSKNEALLDYSTLQFPLLIRTWKAGDYFQPLGLRGKKKVSDFLTDEKVPAWDRKNIFVMISDNHIVWVIGYRIADAVAIRKFPTLALYARIEK